MDVDVSHQGEETNRAGCDSDGSSLSDGLDHESMRLITCFIHDFEWWDVLPKILKVAGT